MSLVLEPEARLTRVVNIKTCSRYDVYVGRKLYAPKNNKMGIDGYFGNRHPIGYFCYHCSVAHSREDSIIAYRDEFCIRLQTDGEFKRRIDELSGLILACFCSPLLCHADIIAKYLNDRIFEKMRIKNEQ